jgi:hypothetical protein
MPQCQPSIPLARLPQITAVPISLIDMWLGTFCQSCHTILLASITQLMCASCLSCQFCVGAQNVVDWTLEYRGKPQKAVLIINHWLPCIATSLNAIFISSITSYVLSAGVPEEGAWRPLG